MMDDVTLSTARIYLEIKRQDGQRVLSVLVVGLKSVESDLQLVGFNWYRHACAITIIEYWSLWFEYMTCVRKSPEFRNFCFSDCSISCQMGVKMLLLKAPIYLSGESPNPLVTCLPRETHPNKCVCKQLIIEVALILLIQR